MGVNVERKLASEGMTDDNTGKMKVSQPKAENVPFGMKIKKEKEAVVHQTTSEVRRPPPAHSTKNTFSAGSAIQVRALDLSKGVRKIKKMTSSSPMYVDGANDTRSSRRSLSETSISSSILETEGDPTQPPSPPVQVSSSGSRTFLSLLLTTVTLQMETTPILLVYATLVTRVLLILPTFQPCQLQHMELMIQGI